MASKQIIVVGNNFNSYSEGELIDFLSRLDSLGVELLIDPGFMTYLSESLHLKLSVAKPLTVIPLSAICCLSLGGDGTFIRAAHIVEKSDIPLLGINFGSLGFLANIECSEATQLVEQIVEGQFEVEKRSLIEVHVGGSFFGYALNEVSVQKRETGSLISIDMDINDEYWASYDADGLIVSTPTGSTAYAVSAGGPILTPECRAFVIVPIAAHSLTMRPLVISDTIKAINLSVKSRSARFTLTIDRDSYTFPIGTQICIKKAPHELGVAKLKHTPFASILRDKLMWASNIRI